MSGTHKADTSVWAVQGEWSQAQKHFRNLLGRGTRVRAPIVTINIIMAAYMKQGMFDQVTCFPFLLLPSPHIHCPTQLNRFQLSCAVSGYHKTSVSPKEVGQPGA